MTSADRKKSCQFRPADATGAEDSEKGWELSKAKDAAYRLLACRPRSRTELETKLIERAYSDSVVHVVIADLERLGYVDDRRFAEQWAVSRARFRFLGRRRIEQELKNKGIDRAVIRDALDVAVPAEDEHATAEIAAKKKLRTMMSLDPETRRRRLAGFLERKGFSSGTIRSLVNELQSFSHGPALRR